MSISSVGSVASSRRSSVSGSSRSGGSVFRSVPVRNNGVRFSGAIKPSGSDNVSTSVGRKRSIKQFSMKKKVAKLSKPMKEAVKRIFTNPEVRGVYKTIVYGAINTGADNLQGITPIGCGHDVDGITTGFFMPSDFLHAASVLWNYKADSQIIKQYDAGNFEPRSLKINVVNSYVAHTLRNNSQGEIKYTVYTCAPKDNMYNGNVPDYVWQRAYATAYNSGLNPQINPTLAYNTLGEVPTKFKEFTQLFKSSYTQFVLAPGQTKTWSTQGPKEMELDLSRQWANDTQWSVFGPYCRFVFIVAESCLTFATDGKIGRFTDLTAGTPYNSAMENVLFYKLSMPEQAGFVYPASTAAGVIQKLNSRTDKYHVYNYGVAQGASNPIIQIDETDPGTLEIGAKI